MKNYFIAIILFFVGLNGFTQAELENWIMNEGEYASYWENTAANGNPPNYVFSTSTTLANVSRVCYDATYVWVEADGMTTEMGQYLNPGAPTAQGYMYRFPRTPTVPATKTTSPLGGSIGLLNNGVPIFGLSNGHHYNGSGNNGNGEGTWNVEVYLAEGFVLDSTLGAHPQQQGAYHSHAKPYRLYASTSASVHSPIVGYAFDGYPIYGPYGYSTALDASSAVTQMATGYALRNITTRTTLPDGTALSVSEYGPAVNSTYPIGTYVEDYQWSATNGGDLDEYNGRFCVTPEYPSGTYAYFITLDANGTPEFPYYIGTEYYGAPEVDDITMGATITVPSSGVSCFTDPLSIDPLDKEATINTFPNPSNGIFNLKLPDLTGTSLIEVTNLAGQLVFSKTITSNEVLIDLSTEKSLGIFVIKITNNGQSYFTKIALQ